MTVETINHQLQESSQDVIRGLGSTVAGSQEWRAPSNDGGFSSSLNDQAEKTTRMFEVFAKQSFDDIPGKQRIRMLMLFWVIRTKLSNSVKRLFDLVFSALLFIIISPFMLITAIAIKIDSPGPVLFRQERIGKWGKPFICYKFRSMFIDAEERKKELMHLNEADAIVFKIARDPRKTRVGSFIRKLSIDELPQLFNVIKGDMSLVGPRPPVPFEVEHYKYEYMQRLHAIPGITGLQQVSGRSDISFERWVELDLQYIQEQSLLKDIQILIKTIPAVITGKGAY